MRNFERLPRTDADQPVDVKGAKQEEEGVNRTEDRKRDRRLLRGQERRHGIGGSLHAQDNPGRTADSSDTTRDNDEKEGERKTQEALAKHGDIYLTAGH